MNKTLEKYASYPIKDNYLTNTDDYQVMETGDVRRRTIYALIPRYIGMGSLIPLPGCKFTWFKNVEVVEKKLLTRWTEFDDGWTYLYYWTSWKESWEVIDVIKINK